MCSLLIFLLKPSAFELLLPPRDCLPSTEFALNKVPAVSNILKGRSLHLIQVSLIMSLALALFLVSTSISF